MKKILYIIGVALAVASCAKDADVAVYDDAAVSFSIGGIGDAVESRATLKSAWRVDDDRLGLYCPNINRYNSEYKVASVDGDSNKATLAEVGDAIYDRRAESESWDFYAYHPYDAANGEESSELKIDVSDQSNVVDLLVASAASAAGEAVEFTFAHALTCVQIEFAFADNFEATDADFTNHKMVLGGVSTDATYDLAAASDNLSAGTTSGDVAFSYDSELFTAILVPGDYSSKVMTLSYDEGGLSHEFTFTLPTITYSAGTIYKYKVTVDGSAKLTYLGELAWNESNISQEYSYYFEYWIDVAASSYAGGSGTDSDPYLITDGYELAKMAVDAAADASSGIYYKVTKDIDLSTNGAQWCAIGGSSNYFKGNFDGGGHTISGLYINNESSYQGFFGSVDGATISNVNVVGDVTAGSYVGGIVGNMGTDNGATTITNCSYSGAVSGTGSCIGGIAGYNKCTIANCYNMASVSGSSSNYVGGVVGRNYGGTVSVCYNVGAVTLSGSGTNVGAVVGYFSSGTISDCYYDSETSVATNSYYATGRTDMKSQTFAADLTTAAEKYNKTATIKACEWSGSNFSYPELLFDAEALPTEFDGGSGISTDPYQISNAKQLAAVADYINTDNSNYGSLYYKLTADIDLSILGGEWTPIGNGTNKFQGNFDGDGHTISGLYINNQSGNQGLFGYISDGATISNVNVAGYVGGLGNLGGIVGYMEANSTDTPATLTNCSFSGVVKGTSDTVGGIVGFSQDCIIANCYNLASVSGVETVGGVVGYICLGDITVCYNAGAVSGTGSYIGAVVGRLSDISASNCYYDSDECTASGTYDVIPKTQAEMQTEAFAATLTSAAKGYNASSTVKACEWIGSDGSYPTLNFGTEAEFPLNGSGTTESPFLIDDADDLATMATLVNAGTTGCVYAVYAVTSSITLSGEWTPIGSLSCQFQGTFNGDGHTISGLSITGTDADYQGLFGYANGATITNVNVSGSVKGDSYVGGVAGYASSSTITSCSYSGAVEGGSSVGGIVGSSSSSTITNCSNSGAVEGDSSVGGIAGYSSNSTIANCYNLATVDGNSSTGGVVGKAFKGTITICYNAGAVTGTGDNIGAVLGENNVSNSATVSDCYYDSDECTASNTNGGTGKGTTDMQTGTFATTLNSAAETYNTTPPTVNACAWVGSDGSYPTLDVTSTPQ